MTMDCKVRVSSLIIFVSLFCSFIPMSFYYISNGWVVILLIRCVRFALIAYLAAILMKQRRIRRRFSAMLLFLFFLLATTLINGGTLTTIIDNISIILIVMLVTEHYIFSNEERKYDALKVMHSFFLIMMSVNLVLMIIQPEGVFRVIYEKDLWHELSYPVHFLNSENRLIEFELPLAVLTIILYEKKILGRFISSFSLLLVVVTLIKAASLTSIAGIIVFAATFLLIRKKNVKEKIQLLYPVVFFFQIIFEAIMTNAYVMAFINFIFGRVDTLFTRHTLAEEAKTVISNNLAIGVGASASGRLFAEGSIIYWVHNHSLDMLVQSGLIGYVLFIRNLVGKVKNNGANLSMERKIVFAALISLFVMGMAESFMYSIEFYLLLALSDI